MKILFISEGCHPGTSGGIQTFGRALKKMYSNDLGFIATNKDTKKIYDVKDVEEVRAVNFLPERIVNKLSNNYIRNKIYRDAVNESDADICVLRSPQNLYFLKNTNIKKVLVQHSCMDSYFNDYYLNDNKLLELSKKELDYFVVLSPQDKDVLEKKLKFPSEKIKIIRHSCEIERLDKKTNKNNTLIMIARLDNRIKKFDLAIKAMKSLPMYNLKIYGGGSDFKYLSSLISKLNLKNVELCGETSKVAECLDDASIFLMLSEDEGYGITNIEAMRRGLPLIIRNTFPGAVDIIDNNGILLSKEWDEKEFIKGVQQVSENYDYYSQMSIEHSKLYDINLIKKQWDDLFFLLKGKKYE